MIFTKGSSEMTNGDRVKHIYTESTFKEAGTLVLVVEWDTRPGESFQVLAETCRKIS